MKILDAARMAPTTGNQQPCIFLVIENRRKLDKLLDQAFGWYLDAYKNRTQYETNKLESTQQAVKKILKDVLSAPVYIAVLVDSRAAYPEYITYDGTLAAGYLTIAARALGYGTGFFTSFFSEKKMKQFFKIPDEYKLICFTPIGILDQWPEMSPKKALDELIVFESFKKHD